MKTVTCSQRTVPLQSGWLSWQRSQSCDPRLPSSLRRTDETSYYKKAATRDQIKLPALQQHLLTFCIAVRIDRMVSKTDLVAFPGGVNNKVWREKQ